MIRTKDCFNLVERNGQNEIGEKDGRRDGQKEREKEQQVEWIEKREKDVEFIKQQEKNRSLLSILFFILGLKILRKKKDLDAKNAALPSNVI